MLKQQDSQGRGVPPLSRISSADKRQYLNTNSGQQPNAKSATTSQDDLLSSNLSPQSTAIPLIELGNSIENMFLNKFHSLDDLDGGFAKPGVSLSGVTERKWNMNLNVNNLSLDLDTMITLTEFRSLDLEDKHKVFIIDNRSNHSIPLLLVCDASSSHDKALHQRLGG